MKWYRIFASHEEAETILPINTLRRLNAAGRKVCLAHTADGFYAVDDACPHQRASLSEGHLNGYNEVICPLHGYRYDLKSGQECRQKSDDAVTHRLEWRDDGLYLGLPS
ncbi:Ferredoxin subunit of nitrite reductase or a ring-hydroxylating dioxygenase [Catalinimonas alkaloidigena]|uniref:Ferredoxin subunit of nitrite reductase or a ring-hydroxylating dioxygenase n=1 Tax=Catalinimonas alkaloidigena TaxID=1075417 RepID=A0A1G8Y055_9BACT|nr:Rieske 2Fe-2S domain-containing protein [Catalinimonas alkaloidigena]SDJ96163.1 Ferredoxin subunit of nitrite reductase or a ring-hydroxylating dioxygenase [Catalinimonas alkaloidigena]